MNNLKTKTDEELALLYAEGDIKAFDLLLERSKTKLFSYIYFVVRNQNVADDVFQDTFVKAITKIQEGKYQTTGKFGAWIMRIAHNIIMDRFREQKAEKIVDNGKENNLSLINTADVLELNIENKFVNQQVLDDVKILMNKLPESQKEVVFMRFFQDLSFKEISEITGVSINTSLGRMRYALLNMRKMAKAHNISLKLD